MGTSSAGTGTYSNSERSHPFDSNDVGDERLHMACGTIAGLRKKVGQPT